MRITKTTPAVIRELWANCTGAVAEGAYLDELSAAIVTKLYERFAESLVMVRAFLTVPFHSLPARQRQFATDLAHSVRLEAMLQPFTPVHSLLATRGCTAEWNDPRRSQGHVAIPLLSEAFVGSIPMMSRLLNELGQPLTWVQDPGRQMVRQVLGSEVGFFFVADASDAVDELGRKIIPAQEFVVTHKVRSVFAVGGTVFGGAVFVLIFFSRDPLEPRTARAFMPFVNLVKGAMVTRCSMSMVFRPDGTGTAAMGTSNFTQVKG